MRILTAALVAVLTLLSAPSTLQAQDIIDVPIFKKGWWKFDTTEEHSAGTSKYFPNAVTAVIRTVERCVDPTDNMHGIFGETPLVKGASDKPIKTALGYEFPKRYDGKGLARTELLIRSELSYTEINHFHKKKETVIAKWMHECP